MYSKQVQNNNFAKIKIIIILLFFVSVRDDDDDHA